MPQGKLRVSRNETSVSPTFLMELVTDGKVMLRGDPGVGGHAASHASSREKPACVDTT